MHPQFVVDLERGTLSAGVGAHWPGVWRLPAMVARFGADLVRLSTAVADAVGAAPRSDRATAAALDALRPAPAAAPRPVAPAAAPPPGAGAGAVRSWWTGCPGRREQLLHTRPGLVGGLDGVPVADRDRANQVLLDAELSRLRSRAALLDRAGDTAGADRARRASAGLETTRRRLDAGDAYLLRLERGSTGGRLVLAVGDPGHAAHVLTHVPGTTAGWDGCPATWPGSRRPARPPGRPRRTPPWPRCCGPATTLPRPARGGGPGGRPRRSGDLRSFQDGLRAGHAGPVHLTVVGHSYGSTVLGNAARGGGLAADDVVFVGSPGTGAGHASELGTAPGHVWATTARHDPIGRVPGVEVFATSRGLAPTGLLHGPNPAAPGFGARVFDSAPGSALPRPTTRPPRTTSPRSPPRTAATGTPARRACAPSAGSSPEHPFRRDAPSFDAACADHRTSGRPNDHRSTNQRWGRSQVVVRPNRD
ncbi:alpha/beta hydrolase [Pseudonocardia sp. ICBG601]|uniref:alpha/beta hydrolase n=1 Tax=Pseudonocardia sp. ICBG601 TaxID=2846759 RepID=UPI001CF687A8|nr:alpha/beta hydrolase [Pseudonocardia sp. ICBG601]